MTEILVTGAAGAAVGLVGKILWERWTAADRLGERLREEYVSRQECHLCARGTTQRVEVLEQAVGVLRNENREDHSRIFGRLDDIADAIRRRNGGG